MNEHRLKSFGRAGGVAEAVMPARARSGTGTGLQGTRPAWGHRALLSWGGLPDATWEVLVIGTWVADPPLRDSMTPWDRHLRLRFEPIPTFGSQWLRSRRALGPSTTTLPADAHDETPRSSKDLGLSEDLGHQRRLPPRDSSRGGGTAGKTSLGHGGSGRLQSGFGRGS